MKSFFHGWRRKLGCITLVVACVLMGMWITSGMLVNFCEFSVRDRQHAFGSFHGYLSWRSWDSSWGRGQFWQSLPAASLPADSFLDLDFEPVASSNPRQWVIPHAWIVVPLTFLSAYLLLIPSQKRHQQ